MVKRIWKAIKAELKIVFNDLKEAKHIPMHPFDFVDKKK